MSVVEKQHLNISLKVEEESRGSACARFSSLKHRMAALRVNACTEQTPAAWAGDAGDVDKADDMDMGGMDKAYDTELALVPVLAACTEHTRGRPQANPTPGHCTVDTMYPIHDTDLNLVSCLLVQDKANRFSTDPESALFLVPVTLKSLLIMLTLFWSAYQTNHIRQNVNSDTRPAPICGTGDTCRERSALLYH